MSSQATREQVERLASLAWSPGDGRLQLMLDLDLEGRKGMGKLLGSLSPEAYVRVVWTTSTSAGRFAGQQPEDLDAAEVAILLTPADDGLRDASSKPTERQAATI